MKKWSTCRLLAILIVLTVSKTYAQKVELLKTSMISDYPSASGIEYHNGRLYIIGDDAKNVLITDTAHRKIDSILLFPSAGYRLSWKEKPDMESFFLGVYKKQQYLISLPSFSNPIRNKVAIIPLNNIGNSKVISINHPDVRLKALGIKETNIEGSTIAKKWLVASNRANLSQKKNELILVKANRALNQNATWKKIEVVLTQEEDVIGISGLEYWKKNDILLFTASTEATTSANLDGEIGDSYIGIINNFSRQLKQSVIKADTLLNISKSFNLHKQKIESICIEQHDSSSAILHLVADNDDGRSLIYKVRLTLSPL